MDQNLDYTVHTFGCKVNTYDSGLIQKNLNHHGYNSVSLKSTPKSKQENQSKKPLIHVLNTCAVTQEATKEAIRVIRRIKSKEPLSLVVVTGCAAQVDTGAFEKVSGADLIVANSHKGLLPEIIKKYYSGHLESKVFKSNIFKKEDLEMGGGIENTHSRSFLKIQDGCNSFCTFCIIPYARGKSRSIPAFEIIKRIQELEMQGQKEIVLTGVHIGDYEDESSIKLRKLDLSDLVQLILDKTTIQRLRLSSLEPIEITDSLFELFKTNNRLCSHFHMSIQSADTEVLRLMKRKYDQDEVIKKLNLISSLPNVFVGMDVIAGFPTETEEQFENTYKALAETPWTRLHVFPYSERSGTKADLMPQINFHVRKERAKLLRNLSDHRHQSEALKQIGKTYETLILAKPSREAQGLTRNYWPVYLPQLSQLDLSAHLLKEVHVKITDSRLVQNDIQLIGELC